MYSKESRYSSRIDFGLRVMGGGGGDLKDGGAIRTRVQMLCLVCEPKNMIPVHPEPVSSGYTGSAGAAEMNVHRVVGDSDCEAELTRI